MLYPWVAPALFNQLCDKALTLLAGHPYLAVIFGTLAALLAFRRKENKVHALVIGTILFALLAVAVPKWLFGLTPVAVVSPSVPVKELTVACAPSELPAAFVCHEPNPAKPSALEQTPTAPLQATATSSRPDSVAIEVVSATEIDLNNVRLCGSISATNVQRIRLVSTTFNACGQ